MVTDHPTTARKGASKMRFARFEPRPSQPGPKPHWLRVRSPSNPEVKRIKAVLRNHRLHTVCEEASCPNIGECFSRGTATFMVLGDVCTRKCAFCDVAHGRPAPPDPNEPAQLADAVIEMGLHYVVITSVDRDDLRDGGAQHFAKVIQAIRARNLEIGIEILVPDFRNRVERALEEIAKAPPEVFNHNIETVPELYRQVRPGSNYPSSLHVLRRFGELCPTVPTKSGMMLGLGETLNQVRRALEDLRTQGVEILTLGQYLAPSPYHHPVREYIHPDTFATLKEEALAMGFRNVNSGPLVRSSYHAEEHACT